MSRTSVTPRVWIGFLVVIGFMLVNFSLSRLGLPAVGSYGACAVLVIVVTTSLGWWRPVLSESRRSVHHWPIVAPAATLLAVICSFLAVDWKNYPSPFLLALLSTLLIGFCEEIVFRGVLLVGLRSRLQEGMVWLVSTAAFSIAHLTNLLGGQNISATIVQCLGAFGVGTIFYVLRRVSGSLIPAMGLHSLIDLSPATASESLLGDAAGLIQIIAFVLSVVSVRWVVQGARRRVP